MKPWMMAQLAQMVKMGVTSCNYSAYLLNARLVSFLHYPEITILTYA